MPHKLHSACLPDGREENYFKYLIENYDFDKMIQYGYENLDENILVVNPPYSRLSHQIKKEKEKKARIDARLFEKSAKT